MVEFKKKLSRLFELPPDAMIPAPKMILSADGELLVTGKTALEEYTREKIKISTEILSAEINGTELYISAMDRMGMCIVGKIESIRFGE